MSDVIRNCKVHYRCPLLWDSLEATSLLSVRFCTQCKKSVHYCETALELYEAIKEDHCVAITLHGDNPEPERLMGDIRFMPNGSDEEVG